MKKTLEIAFLLIILITFNSCVSNKNYAETVTENENLKLKIERLKDSVFEHRLLYKIDSIKPIISQREIYQGLPNLIYISIPFSKKIEIANKTINIKKINNYGSFEILAKPQRDKFIDLKISVDFINGEKHIFKEKFRIISLNAPGVRINGKSGVLLLSKNQIKNGVLSIGIENANYLNNSFKIKSYRISIGKKENVIVNDSVITDEIYSEIVKLEKNDLIQIYGLKFVSKFNFRVCKISPLKIQITD